MAENSVLDKVKKFLIDNLSVEEKIQLKNHAKEIEAEVKLEEVKAEEAPTADPSVTEVPLKDGSVLKVHGELASGTKVTIVTAEGELPATEGDLEATDGTIIKVKKEGEDAVIDTVTVVDEAALKAKEAELAEQNKVEEQVKERVTKIVEKFEAQLSAQTEEIKKYKSTVEELELKFSKQAVSLKKASDFISELTNIPTEEPIKAETNEIPRMYKGLEFLMNRQVKK